MRFKKPKEDVLNELKWNAFAIITRGNVSTDVADTIAEGIKEAFRTLLESEYTDEDFEKDMNLK
jgi:hypothetical protein